ncbi:MAG: hypothetical protein K2M75_06730 [Clostridia bacterium]|nr:hypothetical protein [Clostridia bacterium]
MSWFNYYGLGFMVVIMIPNIVYALKCKSNAANTYKNKVAEIVEQISRFACLTLMIFNVPYTWKGFYFSYAEVIYIIVNSILVIAYCLAWAILWKKSGIVKVLLLSIIPSTVFLFSGIMIASIPLIVFAVTFSVTHIFISLKSAQSI